MSKTLKQLEMIYQMAKIRLSAINLDDEFNAITDIEKVKQIVRDLKLHEIELEMQNWELLKASNEIERISNCYQSSFENAPVSILRLNVKGLILSMNATFSNMLNLQKWDINSTNIYSLFKDRTESDKLHIAINKLIGTKANQVFELSLGGAGLIPLKNLATITIGSNKETEDTEINLCLMTFS